MEGCCSLAARQAPQCHSLVRQGKRNLPNTGLGVVAHIQHFRGTGKEEHPKLQASQSYQGPGKKKKGPAGENPELWLLSLVLHPTSLDLKCPLGFLEESSLWQTLRHWAAALLPSGPESGVSMSRCAASIETPPGPPLQLCTAAYRVA